MERVIFNNLISLLIDRGVSEEQINQSNIKNLLKIDEPKDNIIIADINSKIKHKIIFLTYKKSGIKETRHAIENCELPGKNIIIFSTELTTFSTRMIEENKAKKNIEIWTLQDLFIDPTKHYMCPKHEIIGKNEKDMVLNTYKARSCDFAKISVNDPVIRWYGGKRGSMVRVTRPTPNGFFYFYYRIIN